LKILTITGSDSKGGSSKVASVLSSTLQKRGHEVQILAGSKDDLDSSSIELTKLSDIGGDLGSKIVHRLGLNSLNLQSPYPKALWTQLDDLDSYDLLHLHDLPGFNLTQLPHLARSIPCVWTFHTLTPITGNCLYPYSCDRYQRSCGNCPQFGQFPISWLHRDSSNWILKAKRHLAKRTPITIAGVSQWVIDHVEKSIYKDHPLHVVPNGIALDHFEPIPTAEAKHRLGIPPERFTVLSCTSSSPDDTRKGFDITMAALKQMGNSAPLLILLGIDEGTEALSAQLAANKIDHLPPRHISSDCELSVHYSAADLVWHPSRADTSSIVSMEAATCGTPIIAAAVGGVPEVVQEDQCGILIPPEDPEALAVATRSLIQNPERLKELGKSAVKYARSHFDADQMANQYLEVYKVAIAEHRR